MSKRKKARYQNKRIANQKIQSRPDDYYQLGPLQIARFGRKIVMKNKMSPSEFQEMQKEMANHYPVVCQEIDSLIEQIVSIVTKLSPSESLKRAYWEMAAHHLNMVSESEAEHDDVISLRMVDYLQSIISSAMPSETISSSSNISEETWTELKKLVGALFLKLSTDYQLCRTSFNQINNPDFDLDYESFCYEAQQYWVNVRGHRYLVHDLTSLSALLAPHDEVFKDLFGIGTNEFIANLKMIQDSLTLGIGKVMNDFDEFRKAVIEKAQHDTNIDEIISAGGVGESISRAIEANNWQDWQQDILGRLLGLDLFDLDKITNFPQTLLDELSWEPGQDREFLEEGQLRGWPLRIWPIFKRPFIKLDGKHYCFDLYSLFDHFYRVIERIIKRLNPQYIEEWNRKQKEITELLPFDLFLKLLPDARVYRQVYYPNENGQWFESDGVLFWEDHLFIIEIKAGAFTYKSPATDFPDYIASIKKLLLEPVEQGTRFLKYLYSGNKVALFDKCHTQIGEISKNDFEHITLCAISIDEFTELAAKSQHLKNIGVDVGEKPVWTISLDNLREYADIFDNPLIFLNFLEERMRAFKTDLVDLNDELDHLGLYLRHHSYTKYAKELAAGGKINLQWYGYRSDIDKYFAQKLLEPNKVHVLKQDIPEKLNEIINFLSVNSVPHRRKIASMLLDSSERTQGDITAGIEDALARQYQTKYPLPLSSYGEIKITIFCWQIGILLRNYTLAQTHAKAVMMLGGESERLLLELVYDVRGALTSVYPTFVTLFGSSDYELEKIKIEAARLRRTRLNKAINERGKIGRNEFCPCGSGEKYKRCCGANS